MCSTSICVFLCNSKLLKNLEQLQNTPCIVAPVSLNMVPVSASTETGGMLWKWCGRMSSILVWSVSITTLPTNYTAFVILSSSFGAWVGEWITVSTQPWLACELGTICWMWLCKARTLYPLNANFAMVGEILGVTHTHIGLTEANASIMKHICGKDHHSD